MSNTDREYFRTRAATERAMASAALDPKAVAAHLELAQRYETLLDGPQLTLVDAVSNRASI